MDFANKIQIEDTVTQKCFVSQFWLTQGSIFPIILFLGAKKTTPLLA